MLSSAVFQNKHKHRWMGIFTHQPQRQRRGGWQHSHVSLANKMFIAVGHSMFEKKNGNARCGVGVWNGYIVLSWILSILSSSACNKGIQLLGSAAAAPTTVFFCGSSRQILITCWQTKKAGWGGGGGYGGKMRNICCFLRDEGRGRSPFGLSGRRECVRLLTLQQQIIIMSDERYHSPCRVRTGAHWTFIAFAKHNGMCEWLPVEATPLTRHCGDKVTNKGLENSERACLNQPLADWRACFNYCKLLSVSVHRCVNVPSVFACLVDHKKHVNVPYV